MSRRNKEVNKEVPVMDAFSNPLFRLGFGSQAPLEATEYPLTRLTQNYALLNSMYRSGGILQSVVDIIPADMCREWFTLGGDIDPEDMDKLETATRRTKLRASIIEGLKWGRLYGGAIGLIMIRGQERMLDKPLKIESVLPDSFAGLYILDRWSGVSPQLSLVSDISDPDFGLPEYYDINSGEGSQIVARVHHSRVVRFTGRELPYLEKIAELYWGESEVEPIYDDIVLYDNIMHNMGNLTFRANIDTMEVQNLDQLFSVNSKEQQKRFWDVMQAQSVAQSNFGTRLVNKGDQVTNTQYTFTGWNYVTEAAQLNLCAKTHIPMTKLFGRAPAGLSATGEGDMKNYYDIVDGEREAKLRPALERVLPILCMSAWGEVPEDLSITFPPLWTPNATEIAQIAKMKADTVIAAFQSGLLDVGGAQKELQGLAEETGMFDAISDEDIEANKGKTYQDVTAMADPMAGLFGKPSGEGENSSPFTSDSWNDDVIWKTNRKTGNKFPVDKTTGKPLKKSYDPDLTDGRIRDNIPLLDRIAGENDVVSIKEDDDSISHYALVPGTAITDIEVFAGAGLTRGVDIGIELEGKTGIPAEKWQKLSGHATVNYQGARREAHVHWFEAEKKAYSRKVKGWRKGDRK